MPDQVKEFIDSLPPSNINNSRSIARNAYEKSKVEGFGGYWTRQFEEMSGIPSDRGAEDTGMERELTNNE